MFLVWVKTARSCEKELKMLSIFLVDPWVLRLSEGFATRLLKLLGGPDRVPQRNEDLVWY
jgi:hypothetical protein